MINACGELHSRMEKNSAWVRNLHHLVVVESHIENISLVCTGISQEYHCYVTKRSFVSLKAQNPEGKYAYFGRNDCRKHRTAS